MSRHNKFAAIGKFFGEAQEPLSNSAYERYKAKYGHENADGYLQAIRDMNEALREIVRPGFPAGPQKISTGVDKLFLHNINFLNSIDEKKNPSNNGSNKPLTL